MDEAVVPGTSPRKGERPFTYGDYKSWPEGEHWELIHGEAYSMSPAPRRLHQNLVLQFAAELDSFFAGKPCRPHIAPVDVFLPEGDEAIDDIEHVVQPDAFVVCDKSKLIDEGVLGAPDFVVEVLSPGTAMKDQTQKRMLYESHSVREYWIVNPDTLEVFIYLLKDSKYGLPSVADLREATAVNIFPGLALRARPEDL
ncbi:MAG: Uma2 family endonuclease [Spirochaetae bacterium HGW-Spirochaetae-7]|jgi:Uma2 family endonuclease|nr:MAG: Uma2 family endonuclease [Spirochaetae bacterium HGW-Spirochaetae-7]